MRFPRYTCQSVVVGPSLHFCCVHPTAERELDSASLFVELVLFVPISAFANGWLHLPDRIRRERRDGRECKLALNNIEIRLHRRRCRMLIRFQCRQTSGQVSEFLRSKRTAGSATESAGRFAWTVTKSPSRLPAVMRCASLLSQTSTLS